jgi:ribosomal protein S9
MSTATTTVTATAAKGPDSKGWFWGTGRRKTAIARVRVRPGNGDIKLNEKTLEDYLTEDKDRKAILAVLEKTGGKGKVDVTAGLVGGGRPGRRRGHGPRPCRHGIRQLARADPARARVPHP